MHKVQFFQSEAHLLVSMTGWSTDEGYLQVIVCGSDTVEWRADSLVDGNSDPVWGIDKLWRGTIAQDIDRHGGLCSFLNSLRSNI